jgi:ketosteroid isomerase-like protein
LPEAELTAVRRFFEAFNEDDLDGFAALLAPDVEIQTSRGLREGIEEARSWARRTAGGMLIQSMVVDELFEGGSHVVAFIRRRWSWEEEAEVAEEEERATLFTFRDGKIVRVQPFGDRSEALRAAGLD